MAPRTPRRLIRVDGLSNQEFLTRYAAAGRVGLAGGGQWIDLQIRRSERRLRADSSPSLWSHAMLFQGRRRDGRHWVVEADVDWEQAQFRNGVQENRVDKYFDEKKYPSLAILDFRLRPPVVDRIISQALDLVSARMRYSYTGILATWLAMHQTKDRQRGALARLLELRSASALRGKRRTYCSSLIQLLFREAGLRFAPGLSEHHVTPEHIAQTGVPHTAYLLERASAPGL